MGDDNNGTERSRRSLLRAAGAGIAASAGFAGSSAAEEMSNVAKEYKYPCLKGHRRRVTICHRPPGNPENGQTLRLPRKAARKHLSNHPDDHCGPCEKHYKDS